MKKIAVILACLVFFSTSHSHASWPSFTEGASLFFRSLFCDIEPTHVKIAQSLENGRDLYSPIEQGQSSEIIRSCFPLNDFVIKLEAIEDYLSNTSPKVIALDMARDLYSNPLDRLNLAMTIVGPAHEILTVAKSLLSKTISARTYWRVGRTVVHAVHNGLTIDSNTMQTLVVLTSLALLPTVSSAENIGPNQTCQMIGEELASNYGWWDALWGRTINQCLNRGDTLESCWKYLNTTNLEAKGYSAALVACSKHTGTYTIPELVTRIQYQPDSSCIEVPLPSINDNSIKSLIQYSTSSLKLCFNTTGDLNQLMIQPKDVSSSDCFSSLRSGQMQYGLSYCRLDDISCFGTISAESSIQASDRLNEKCFYFHTHPNAPILELCLDPLHPERHSYGPAGVEMSHSFLHGLNGNYVPENLKFAMAVLNRQKPLVRYIADDTLIFDCNLPIGSFLKVCKNITVHAYKHRLYPTEVTCRVTAVCPTLPPVSVHQVHTSYYHGIEQPQFELEAGELVRKDTQPSMKLPVDKDRILEHERDEL